MDHSVKVGLSFGLTSGIITTMGLMIGLQAGTHSRLAVLGGILTIAIADSLSDALGIHISEESENRHTEKEIWTSTMCTFIFKFIFALTFAVPVLLLELSAAIFASIAWGMAALTMLSIYIARDQNRKILPMVFEHLAIAVLVIILSNLAGTWISSLLL